MLFAFLTFALVGQLPAERNHLKPTDFQPLTSLPWKKDGATMESALDAIFRETNSDVRARVLAEYLHFIPVAELGKAFDICISLEGTQTPTELVRSFLPIWAKRDPVGCWKRTKSLFHLVGIESDWMDFDSWKDRDAITVPDLRAIRASSYWLTRDALLGFPAGVEKSSLPEQERLRLLREFANTWFDAFATWPRTTQREFRFPMILEESLWPGKVLEAPLDQLRDATPDTFSGDGVKFEIALRRCLQAEPKSAPAIVKKAGETKLPPQNGEAEGRIAGPSTELLVLWAQADLDGMIRWAESQDAQVSNLAVTVRAFLMSRVDAATRERWLAQVKLKDGEDNDGKLEALLLGWAEWDLLPGLDAALATNELETIEEICVMAPVGPFGGGPPNAAHYNLGMIKQFDASRLPKVMRDDHYPNWEEIMEVWGDIDIGEAAQYGLDFMLRNRYVPRENLIRLFSGDDKYAVDGNMIDRTFCALRVWAVVRPKEMKTWIATLPDKRMRTALTWLSEHPWGGLGR